MNEKYEGTTKKVGKPFEALISAIEIVQTSEGPLPIAVILDSNGERHTEYTLDKNHSFTPETQALVTPITYEYPSGGKAVEYELNPVLFLVS